MVKRAGPGGPDEIAGQTGYSRRYGQDGYIIAVCAARWRRAWSTYVVVLVFGLILEPAQTFLASQHVQNLKYAR